MGHDKPQMAMDTATMGGRDGMGIGVNFFGEEFNGGVGRHSDNLSERGMLEGEVSGSSCHC